MEDWKYSGDVNLEYGGVYAELDNWKYGYANACRITDLDSGCGFDGAVLIERLSVIIDKKRIRQAVESCGCGISELRDLYFKHGREAYKLAVIDALVSYGSYDPDDAWDGYQTGYSETVQTVEGAPMEMDGWKATKFVASKDLKGYVESVWLA